MRKPGHSPGASGCARTERFLARVPHHPVLRARVLPFRRSRPLQRIYCLVIYINLLTFVLSSSVKSTVSLARPRSVPFWHLSASSVFNHLQTLLRTTHLQPELTPVFSFTSVFFCICGKSVDFRSFVFLHLHTPFHSFTRVIGHHQSFQSLAHSLQENRGVGGYTFSGFPHPSRFGYNSPPWFGCHPKPLMARFGLAQSPDCAFHFDEVLG